MKKLFAKFIFSIVRTLICYLVPLALFIVTVSCSEDEPRQITPSNGRIVFWTSFVGAPINVWVDEEFKGQVLCVTGAPPTCGQLSTCLNLTLTTGEHTYRATDGEDNWSGKVNIVSGGCRNIKLQDL